MDLRTSDVRRLHLPAEIANHNRNTSIPHLPLLLNLLTFDSIMNRIQRHHVTLRKPMAI